jgi:hypothetical protein
LSLSKTALTHDFASDYFKGDPRDILIAIQQQFSSITRGKSPDDEYYIKSVIFWSWDKDYDMHTPSDHLVTGMMTIRAGPGRSERTLENISL